MAKTWAIQNSGLSRRDDAEKRLINALNGDSGLQEKSAFTTFGVIPFEKTFVGHEEFPNEPMFPYCSTKALRLLTAQDIRATDLFLGVTPEVAEQHRRNLRAGLFYDIQRFDQAFYMRDPAVRAVLLNGDGDIRLLRDVKNVTYNIDKFMKPTKDLKLFAGVRVYEGQTLDAVVKCGMVDVSYHDGDNETVLVANIKEVLREWRFFVVNGQVITGSQYMVKGDVRYNSDVPRYVFNEAQELAQVYQPAAAFTMDVCLTGDAQLKIVEYNCINCSGLYHANIRKLVEALS